MIAVIDYGMGNLRSVEKAFEFLGFAAKIVDEPEQAAAVHGTQRAARTTRLTRTRLL